jgi:hypothetical protein
MGTDAGVVSRACGAADLGIDPDHEAARVEERPTGVAVRDGGIRLDRVDDVVLVDGDRLDRAVDRRDDADGERILVSERAPDGRNGLTDDNGRRLPERDRSEPVIARIDADQADVVKEVPADHLRLDSIPVVELDEQMARRPHAARPAGVRDHVRVREDIAVRRRHEPGPLRDGGVLGRRISEVGENRHDAG